MSSSPELQLVLRELASLQTRVARLEEQLSDLQAGATFGSAAPVTVKYSFSGAPSSVPAPIAEPASAPEVSSQQQPLTPSSAGYYSDEFRSRVACEAGAFIRRSLNGIHRGESGRDRIKLQSRLYLVFRDFKGNCYNPVRVCHTFSECKALVKPDGYCGDSIFVGWPTLWEAKLRAREASVAWPSDAGGSGR